MFEDRVTIIDVVQSPISLVAPRGPHDEGVAELIQSLYGTQDAAGW